MRGLHWFRNDLRLGDNRALTALVGEVDQWAAIFVREPRLLGDPCRAPRRVAFLEDCLRRLSEDLAARGVTLQIVDGPAEEIIPRFMVKMGISVLSFNRGPTPFSRARDQEVRTAVEKEGHRVLLEKDHVIFSAGEILSGKGEPYSVYTPYRNAWWKKFGETDCAPTQPTRWPAPIPGLSSGASSVSLQPHPWDEDCRIASGGEQAAVGRLESFLQDGVRNYERDRDRPDRDGTSRLSPHLRFGTLSVRECFDRALKLARHEPTQAEGIKRWLDELIWREFYNAVLEANPRVLTTNHRRDYDVLVWRDDPREFEAWCQGRTGYPMVDAGMRQLRETGWMHNRARMIVASFLTKNLLVDWREGARIFFEHLVDGDPASNNGGWQWAASTGTDSQPFFRIFNPLRQAAQWDPQARYIQRWVPELQTVPVKQIHTLQGLDASAPDYPHPIVDHQVRRVEALDAFRRARKISKAVGS